MEERRDKRNIVYFIISYVINNLASGVLCDTFVNYLQEAQTSIATSFWAFYGYATFISAALLLLVPKIGYKKLLLFCSLSTACAFFWRRLYGFYLGFIYRNPIGINGCAAALYYAESFYCLLYRSV